MKRIMVIGVSAGVGKSTFAKELVDILDLDVYHLDALFWKANWVEASLEEFIEAQQTIANQDRWIMEGNYMGTFSTRTRRADTIIYLELPLYICLYRVVKRWFHNRGRTRSDMGEGCEEKIDWPFIKFILSTYYSLKEKMPEKIKDFQTMNQDNFVFTLKSKKEIQAFKEKLKKRAVPLKETARL